MIIAKSAENRNQYRLRYYYYDRARDGLHDVLKILSRTHGVQTVLLPGYIGLSAREGSGIWDPIQQIDSLNVKFYRMTADLTIDADNFLMLLKESRDSGLAVLIINYYGFTDMNALIISNLTRLNGGILIEDNAHGFFSYQYRKADLSDINFFSLHKMFPFIQGGVVFIKSEALADIPLNGRREIGNDNPWDYDINLISKIRRDNFQAIDELVLSMPDNSSYFLPLRQLRSLSDVPQSYPIILTSGSRDYVYHSLNSQGFGVVSLYHTLIEPLRCADHEAALGTSRCILNLPVHQDVDRTKYRELLHALRAACQQSM